MKKISYGLLISLLCLFNIGVVKAASCDFTATGDTTGNEKILFNFLYSISDDTHSMSETEYQFKASGDSYAAFCRNAGQTSYTSSDSLTCTDVISTSGGNAAVNAGILAIINEYQDTKDYWSTLIALRMYDNLFTTQNTNAISSSMHQYQIGWNLSYAWLANQAKSDPEVSEYLSKLTNVATSISYTYKGFYTIYSTYETTKELSSSEATITIENVTFTNSDYYDNALNYLKTGLKAAADYAENGSSTGAVTVTASAYDPEINEDGNNKYKATLTFLVKYEGYGDISDEDDRVLTLSFKDNISSISNSINRKVYIRVNSTNSDDISDIENINASDYVDLSSDGSFYLVIEYSNISSNYCSNDIEPSLDVTYPGEDSDYDFTVYEMAGCYGNTGKNCQYFYVVDDLDDAIDNSVATDGLVTDTYEVDPFSPCDFSCEDLQRLCGDANNDPNNTYCQQFESEYGSTCVECTTYFSEAACNASGTTLEIQEGTEGSIESCDITTDLNVLQCIIDKKDLTDENLYKVTSTDAGAGYANVISNDYCSVYCREWYKMELPGIQELNSGRYFTLSVTIAGGKDCYTNEIDYDSFETKEKELRQAIYTAYNEWIKIKTAYDAFNAASELTGYDYYNEESSTYIDGYGYACLVYYNNDVYWYYGLPYNTRTSYTYKWIYQPYSTYDSEGRIVTGNIVAGSYGSVASRTANNDDYGCATSYTSEVNTPETDFNNSTYGGSSHNVVQNLKDKADALNDAITTYMELINTYNYCSGSGVKLYKNIDSSIPNQTDGQTGWNMSYTFEPDVSFWYEELTYINSSSSVISTTLATEGTSSVNDGITQTYFTCDVNDEYSECSGGEGSKKVSNTLSDYYELNNLLCYKSGESYTCDKSKTVYVSKAKYVKQEMTANGQYITPTQFYTIYSSGAIVVVDDVNVTSDDIDNSTAIVNGLPVGLGTVSGVYNYVLQISNLGNYNDSSYSGRIWGGNSSTNSSTSVVSVAISKFDSVRSVCYSDFALTTDSTLSESNTVLDLEAGVYVCAYTVSCPDCPVECTPVCGGCIGDNCPPTCTNCIYTYEDNVSYRPITTDDINPNNRELGSNWNYAGTASSAVSVNSISPSNITTMLQLKAYATAYEIVEDGDSIYNVVVDEETGNVTKEYVNNNNTIVVTMDYNMISWIKEYNSAAGDYYTSNDGVSSTLECHDYVDDSSELQENVFCYSTFLDDLIDNFGSQVVALNRPTVTGRNATNAGVGSYWTTWDSSVWNTYTSLGFSASSYSYSSGTVGPSWK